MSKVQREKKSEITDFMTNEERIEQLINTKTFSALTDEERSFVLEELGSEAQYTAMRRVSLALIASKAELSPDPLILVKLTARMQSRKQSMLQRIVSWRVPAYATALIAVIVSLVSLMVGTSIRKQNIKLVESIRQDTIFVASKPDTIVRERIVYRTIFKRIPVNSVQLVEASEPPQSKSLGVTMKEKQDLDMLLVSGGK